ncbi:MAG: ECF-type sigma factor [Lysobacteraceae bacterium]
MSSDQPLPDVDQSPGTDSGPGQVTAILRAAGDGLARDQLDRLFGLIYAELRRIAARVLGQGQAPTLNATALVHEAYAKLVGSEALGVEGRQHFLALCARVMRQIVIDHARARLSGKRAGTAVPLREDGAIDLSRPESLVAMDAALERLESRDPRLVQLLHYRVFAGLELEEIAPLIAVTVRQLQRDWQRARIWLVDEMLDEDAA